MGKINFGEPQEIPADKEQIPRPRLKHRRAREEIVGVTGMNGEHNISSTMPCPPCSSSHRKRCSAASETSTQPNGTTSLPTVIIAIQGLTTPQDRTVVRHATFPNMTPSTESTVPSSTPCSPRTNRYHSVHGKCEGALRRPSWLATRGEWLQSCDG